MHELSIKSSDKCEMIEISSQINRLISKEGFEEGALLISVPHTTAAVTINESHDSDVKRDIISRLNSIVPFSGDYRHREGNSPAHIKSVLVGSDQMVPVENGKLALGTWQGIFFCEFDGPRSRKIDLQFISPPSDPQ